MPVTILYPLAGEPVRFENGDHATIEDVECVEDAAIVRANVALNTGRRIIAVPVAWDASGGEWLEVSGAGAADSDLGSVSDQG